MPLSLSVRVAEAFDSKEKINLPFGEILGMAVKYGYQAVCMRASAAGIVTPKEVIAEMRQQVDKAGVRVSMVTGDIAVPANSEFGPDGLRYIKPYLDLADGFGAKLIRVCMKRQEDIYWAQRAADEARERGIRLAHQSHTASLFEGSENAAKTLAAINRENFGLIYEPANWFIIGDPNYAKVERFQQKLFNVYVQNHIVNHRGVSPITTFSKGEIRVDHIGIWEPGGVYYEGVLTTLGKIGYNGFVTVHQAFAGIMPVEEAVRRSAEFLKKYLGGTK